MGHSGYDGVSNRGASGASKGMQTVPCVTFSAVRWIYCVVVQRLCVWSPGLLHPVFHSVRHSDRAAFRARPRDDDAAVIPKVAPAEAVPSSCSKLPIASLLPPLSPSYHLILSPQTIPHYVSYQAGCLCPPGAGRQRRAHPLDNDGRGPGR